MKVKKLVALALTAMMVLGTMVGCTKQEGETSDAPASGAQTEASTGEGAASEAAEPAGDVVTLKWVTVGNGMPENYDSWQAKVNEYIGPTIGVNIDVEVVPWGDWDTRRSVIISTNEPFDIIFGNGNVYIPDINIGAYLDITDLIEANMPGLNKLMPEEYWDAVKVGGKIYGVPTYKDSSLTNYMVWDKAIVDEYSLDIANMTTLDSLTESFTTIKNEKNDTPCFLKDDGVYQIFDVYDQMGAGCQVMGVRYDDKEAKVVYTLEQEDIMSNLETIHQWYVDGIVNADAPTLKERRAYSTWSIAQGWPSAGKTVWGPNMGTEAEVVQFGDTILSNDTVRGSLNCISANTEYPEKCLQFLDMMNSDTKLRDMFFFGEEGYNFEYTVDNKVHKIPEKQWGMAGYTQGTFFIVSQQDTEEFNQWDEVKALNENAVPSVLLGFSFDMSKVEDQIANINEVWLRYKSEVVTGVKDPKEIVPAVKEELMKAGLQEVMDEAQAQIDAFLGK